MKHQPSERQTTAMTQVSIVLQARHEHSNKQAKYCSYIVQI